MMGKLSLEMGDEVPAKSYFQTADKKSKGRVWKGEDDPKYYLFYKKK